MLIHLLIWAMRAASEKQSVPKTTPLGARRRTGLGKVALECPFCQHLGVAVQQRVEEFGTRGWQAVMEVYECPKCHRSMNTEAMVNDGNGVLTARLWECPACRRSNPAVRKDCSFCGQKT